MLKFDGEKFFIFKLKRFRVMTQVGFYKIFTFFFPKKNINLVRIKINAFAFYVIDHYIVYMNGFFVI